MSNELTKYSNGGDDGWDDAADDASGKIIQGDLIKFSDGCWTYGQNATILPETMRLVAIKTAGAWVRWEGGKPAQYDIRQPGTAWKERDELGYDDELGWEASPDGKPRDPWQRTKFVYLMQLGTAQAFTFSTSSFSGLDAVEDLAQQIIRKRFSGKKVFPLVELNNAPYKTKYGMKRKPVFKVVSWVDPSQDQVTTEPAALQLPKPNLQRMPVAARGDFDDEVPF